jgi:hypothetical protein
MKTQLPRTSAQRALLTLVAATTLSVGAPAAAATNARSLAAALARPPVQPHDIYRSQVVRPTVTPRRSDALSAARRIR